MGAPAGTGSDNSRNGKRAETVVTEVGPVDVDLPNGQDCNFDDELVLSLPAKDLSTSEASAHLAEVHSAEVSKDTISNITDRVLTEKDD